MAEQIFHKNGQVRYAYKPVQAVRLIADGWVEGEAKASPEPKHEDEQPARGLPAWGAEKKDKGRDS